MEPKSSLPYSQVPATRPYPESTLSNPHNPLQLPEDPSFTQDIPLQKFITNFYVSSLDRETEDPKYIFVFYISLGKRLNSVSNYVTS
jgi:hypothetical protein